MSDENIRNIIDLQKTLPPEQRAYLNRYLSNAPRWVLESIQIIHKEPQMQFVEEKTKATDVYILVEGIVCAIDKRRQGIAYDYIRFYPIKVFGAMEIFFSIPNYMTTLETVTPCTMLVISRENYEKWIWDDKNALQMEMKSMGQYLLEQNRKERVFLFLQGMDRIIYMFVKAYEQKNNEKCVLNMSRQELAEKSGFSIKTVNRAVKKMEEDGYIGREGRKIVIAQEQYWKMKQYLESIVDEN